MYSCNVGQGRDNDAGGGGGSQSDMEAQRPEKGELTDL